MSTTRLIVEEPILWPSLPFQKRFHSGTFVGARRLSYWVDHGLLVVVDDRHEYACDHH